MMTSLKSSNYCNNCGKVGHVFHQCKSPIISIGILVFRINDKGNREYLMICRKDTLGYVDFMRGKYPLYNKLHLLNIINEMTNNEKNNILNKNFDELWAELWGENVGIQYRSEEKVSRDKLESLKLGITSGGKEYTLKSLIEESTTSWENAEWGIPKGRRNYQERDLQCGLREFEEETGYLKMNVQIIQNLEPIEEIFTGSNYKSYKHKYFIGCIDYNISPTQQFQYTEVSKVEWKTYEEALECIRPYNLEKKDVLMRVNTILEKYRLY
tara:strand:- start:2446 stop:3252 length:807 start_codon:yes stop_codon:yes gene_type:complete